MIASEAVVGRTILVVLEPGDDVIGALVDACARFELQQGYIPVFSGAFRDLTIIGTDEPIEDEDAPLGDSIVVRNAEGFGSGTVAQGSDGTAVHLHASVGAKGESSRATAGHVLAGTVQYPVEVVIVEVLSPALVRRPNPAARGIATLTWLAE